MPTRNVPTTHGFNGVVMDISQDTSPAMAWVRTVYHDQTPEALRRRIRVGGMTREEAQDLLLLLAHIAPTLFDRAVEVDRRSR